MRFWREGPVQVSPGQLRIQIERLIDVFGDKHFPEQRERMIWDAVSGLSYDSVIKIVDGFIRANKYAPLPAEFYQAAREFTPSVRKYALGEIQPKDIAKCHDCGDSGFVHVVRLEGHAAWARYDSGSAPCHCDRGRQLIEAGKRMRRPHDFGGQYNELWIKSYQITPAYKFHSYNQEAGA